MKEALSNGDKNRKQLQSRTSTLMSRTGALEIRAGTAVPGPRCECVFTKLSFVGIEFMHNRSMAFRLLRTTQPHSYHYKVRTFSLFPKETLFPFPATVLVPSEAPEKHGVYTVACSEYWNHTKCSLLEWHLLLSMFSNFETCCRMH